MSFPPRIEVPAPAVDPGLLEIRRWNLLLDELCIRAGYHDNAALAAAYCRAAGRSSEISFDAIQKNLHQWRQGRRLPLRRNLHILASILELNQNSALHGHWSKLHALARTNDLMPLQSDELPHVAQQNDGRSIGKLLTATMGAAALVCLTGYSAFSYWMLASFPLIELERQVTMTVGESRIIHGLRGDCGGAPPDWYYSRTLVPQTRLGVFSDGGIGRRTSDACRKIVPVRAARFEARQAGTSRVKLFGDELQLTVLPAHGTR